MFVAVIALMAAVPRPSPYDTVPYRTEEITFLSAGVTLHASLLLPAGTGRHPGVVILHGSGSSDRSNPWTAAYADALARRGIVVLYPDKRGSGKSGGNWKEASMVDLAADGSAALTVLRERTEVDSTRTGVAGFSQGGYIAAILAADDPHCQFAISISGGTASMLRQIVDEIIADAAADGHLIANADRPRLMAMHEIAVDRALGRRSWSGYQHAIDSVIQLAPMLKPVVATFPADSADPTWSWLGKVGTFDPMPYWVRVMRPALFIYGGKDARVRIDESIARIVESKAPIAISAVILRFQGNAHALFRDDEMDFIVRWIVDGGAN